MNAPMDEDLGKPITELETLELEPVRGFRRKLRTRIERRRLAGSSVDLAIPALGEVLRELLDFLFSGRKGEKR